MTWDKDAKKRLEQHQARLEKIHRAAMFRVAFQTDIKSPVDTGRFRSNWIGAYGTVDTETFSSVSRDPVGAVNAYLKGKPVDGHKYFYYTNSLPYAARLEFDGWSDQAPLGMVRITARNFSRYVKEASRMIKI